MARIKITQTAYVSNVIHRGRSLPIQLVSEYAKDYRQRPECTKRDAAHMDEVLAFRELALREAE